MPLPAEKAGRHVSSFHLESLRLDAATGEERAWIDAHLWGGRPWQPGGNGSQGLVAL
jgi:hypothetical protein